MFDLPYVEKAGQWMSKTETELSVDIQMNEKKMQGNNRPKFQANPRHDEHNENDTNEKILKMEKQNKRLQRYKENVERMLKAGLVIQIGGSRDGYVAHNAPGKENGFFYGALTLAFGQAVYLANKANEVAKNDLVNGRFKISYYQILRFVTLSMQAWRLSQTPQLSCSRLDLDLDQTFDV